MLRPRLHSICICVLGLCHWLLLALRHKFTHWWSESRRVQEKWRVWCVFRIDLCGLFEFNYCCLQHQQECKCDYTKLYCNEPHKFIYTIFKCFKCYFCIHGPYRILNGRVLNYWKCFLCFIDILGTGVYHTALTGGIVPLTELNLT